MARIQALLLAAAVLASCAPAPPLPPPFEPLTGFEPTDDFTVIMGTNGSFEEVEALLAQPRSVMRAMAVDSATELYGTLERLGLEPGPTALVRDAEGRTYSLVGTSAGPFLFDISSFHDA